MTINNNGRPPSAGQQNDENSHEQEIEEREAYQYWGYLFKPDKTGTDKLKGLLRGLKQLMNEKYEPSDSADLTPTQLASFYRELNGNYDQLFLGTPSDSIAFIYKSLGCLHSLQPLPHSTAFTEPTVPALKTEGWIMWQTIQLLLGPEEHSVFVREAVQKWDVKDPVTGETLPKILPRQCFPMEPDKHMVDWYEGVSERLRKEAEDEERHRQMEAEQAEVRRIQYRKQRDDQDDNESMDSRGPAMAYFKNPLYRQDGRPTIVRNSSKRPTLSPRRSSAKDKVKGGAATMGNVIRNIGSPHLWEGRGGGKSESRDRSKDHRRRSLPDNRFNHAGERPQSSGYDTRHPSHSSGHQHHRTRSDQMPPADVTPSDENWNADDEDTSPGAQPPHRHHQDEQDPELRHSRSHDPTPSQKEYGDYFEGYDDPNRQSSASVTPNGIGPSFGPSASPLFASHVAKQPQPKNTRPSVIDSAPSRRPPEIRRAQDERRPYSRSPDPSLRPHSRNDRRYGSRERSRPRHDQSPRRRFDDNPYKDGPLPPRSAPPVQGGGYPSVGDPNRRSSNTPSAPPNQGYPPPGLSPQRERRKSGAPSMSDASGYGGEGEEPRRNGPPPKHARFAQGVDGRRYPDESSRR